MIPSSQKEELEIKSRETDFTVLHILAAAALLILAGRLWFLQIHSGEEMSRLSDMNRLKKRALPAPRGFILDRDGKILVKNKTAVQLKISLNETKNLENSVNQIAPLIGETAEKLKRKIHIQKKREGEFHPIVLKERLSRKEIYNLKLLQWDLPGIFVEEGFLRDYPLKENGALILGFTGEAARKQRSSAESEAPLIEGKSGMEKAYDSRLQGRSGVSVVEADALNRIPPKAVSATAALFNREPESGESISLNLSKTLQEAAFRAFTERKDRIGPRTGAAIVMKTDGEILAQLSVPGFDPNFFSRKIGPGAWSAFLMQSSAGGKKGLFVNKGIQEHYPPGSTIKPFLALAALQEGIITAETVKDSTRLFRVGRRNYHDSSPRGHGKVNVIEALERSANTFFYQIGLELGAERIAEYSDWFGFGKKTGVDLPGETSGYSLKNNLRSLQLFPGDTVNLSIGQGYFLTTLLQLAVAYNAIAAEGLLVRPFLIRDVAGKREGRPKVKDALTDRIERRHFKTVKEGLRRVTDGARGTARYWPLKEVSFSGKTGTVQTAALKAGSVYKSCFQLPLERRHHGWFVAFAPSENPQIAVAVLTERSCAGSSGSVPVAREIIRAWHKETRRARAGGGGTEAKTARRAASP